MKQFRSKKEIQAWRDDHTGTIGFVPTMGALHAGHISLITRSNEETDRTIASIYVNPAQFNDPDDLNKYPKTLEADLKMLEQAGCDAVYIPSTSDLYPKGTHDLPHYDLGRLDHIWEAEYRPGHFQGVCAVVHRLLDVVQPQQLFMGLKDLQQVAVVRRLLTLLSINVTLTGCPTIRDAHGLALSSRNARLTPAQRVQACCIYEGFMRKLQPFEFEQFLLQNGFESVDYIARCEPNTLEPDDGNEHVVMLVAARIGGIRLIDNHFIS